MAVFAENFQNYRRKIGPRGSETSKTHCETKLFARRWSIFRIAASFFDFSNLCYHIPALKSPINLIGYIIVRRDKPRTSRLTELVNFAVAWIKGR
jgi:hypothetical protein